MALPRFSGRPRRLSFPLVVRRISGDSMAPTHRSGQLVYAWRWFRRLQPGDVVVLRHAGLEKIKRVQSLHDGEVYVVGDNSSASTDSRHFGTIPQQDVLARVL